MIRKFLKKYKILRLINYSISNNYKKYKIFSNLNKKSIVIDIGAHIGQVSEFINDKYNSKIYAYEPNPFLFKILKQKFDQNKNIKIFNLAVSNSHSSNKLFSTSNKNNNLINETLKFSMEFEKKNIDEKNFINVDVITIDELLRQFDHIDLIKINIEGHEYKILDEIIKNKSKINKVVCQLHGDYVAHLNQQHNDLLSFLKKNNLYNKWFFEY